MIRLSAVAFLAVALSAGAENRFRAKYCPECMIFVEGKSAFGPQGDCAGCRKVPVEVEACSIAWYWCDETAAWRRRPCDGGRCGVISRTTAIFAFRPDEDGFKLRYCPGCRRYPGHHEVEGGPGCSQCGRPFAQVDAVGRTWYWCAQSGAWLDRPCSYEPLMRCCEERTATLLACRHNPSLISSPVGLESGPALQPEMLVSTEWLARHLGDPGIVILHVGFSPTAPDAVGRPFYEERHIPGARAVDWSEITMTHRGLANEMPAADHLSMLIQWLGIGEETRVVLYDTGDGLEAARAFVTFDLMGLGERTSLLDGQWKKWVAESRSTSTDPVVVIPSIFVTKLRKEVLVGLPHVSLLAWMSSNGRNEIRFIDARPPLEFRGEKAGRDVKRPGHIPGARNLFWKSHLVPGKIPVFLDEAELRELYAAAGVGPRTSVIAYCRSGVQASHTYFVARYLGYRVRLYDGSFMEWSGCDDLPVDGPESP